MNGALAALAALICLPLLLLPGLACASAARSLPDRDRLGAAFVLTCCLGYLAFWLYWANVGAGRAFTAAVWLATLVRLGMLLVARDRRVLVPGIAWVLGLYALVVAFYSSLPWTGFHPGSFVDLANEHFFGQWGDNRFQDELGRGLWAGSDVRIVKGWWLPDRPPLQAGVDLVTGLAWAGSTTWLQAMGVALQCGWVLAAAILAERLALPRPAVVRAVILCAFTGFFFLHGVFTWPKLLAGALAVIGAAWVATAKLDEPQGRVLLILGTLAWGCAWMAHGTTGFALPLALVAYGIAAWRHRALWVRLIPLGVGVLALAIAFTLPWARYRAHNQPEGDTLGKYHLAGVFFEKKELPTSQVVREAYAALTPAELAERKLNNVRALILPFAPYENDALGWRRGDYYHLFHALGVLNIGWIALAIAAWRRRPSDASVKKLIPVVGAAALVILFWVLAEFGPTSAQMLAWMQQRFNPPVAVTILHQGSFAPVLLLMFSLAVAVQSLPARLWGAIAAVHIGIFAYVYALAPREFAAVQHPQPLAIVVALACAAALVALLVFPERLSGRPSGQIA